MIEDIKTWLVLQKWAPSKEHITLNARLCGNWSIQCFLKEELKYFMKLSTNLPLTNEVNAIQAWGRQLPGVVPKWLDSVRIKGFEGYLQQGVWHRTLEPSHFFKSKEVQEGLLAYFKASSAQGGHRYIWPEALTLRYEALSGKPSTEMFNLVSCPQHGDFTLTNIGLEKHLWFFDWEDFGKSDFPLLDLTSFLMSLFNFKLSALSEYFKTQASFRQWLQTCLGFYGVSFMDYVKLMPYALILFLELKTCGYSTEVVLKTSQALKESWMDWSR